MKLNTNLWLENAAALRADRIARSNRFQRRLFPWLALLAILSVLFLFFWVQS